MADTRFCTHARCTTIPLHKTTPAREQDHAAPPIRTLPEHASKHAPPSRLAFLKAYPGVTADGDVAAGSEVTHLAVGGPFFVLLLRGL